jgi:hypothetical protein
MLFRTSRRAARIEEALKLNSEFFKFRFVLTLLATLAASGAYGATKCSIHFGAGCGGPIVYEIQLCNGVSFNIKECNRLCRNLRPICSVVPSTPDRSFDPWVQADAKKGKKGLKGTLADNADDYDSNGVLAYTSEKPYTVCLQYNDEKRLKFKYTDPTPVAPTENCPLSEAANCTSGTVYNPTSGTCEIQDAACGSSGGGTFNALMANGQYLVDVQNEHFVQAPGEDPNLQNQAATAGTGLPGLTAPTRSAASPGGMDALAFDPADSAVSAGAASPAGSGSGLGSGSLSTAASTGESAGLNGAKPSSTFASMDFATAAGGEYGKGSLPGGQMGGGGSGPSWFGAGAAATAGAAGADIGFGKGEGASRGLASEGRLQVEDPVNYFLMSDIDVSLFKRITAQCRKKERSLVLSP